MASPMPKTPRRRTRRVAEANSPMPEGVSMAASTCGHSDCGTACNVRYCGPTSHLRDHYAVHAARGAAHVWPAAIVSGLAVILTGTLAYSTMQPAHASSDDLRATTTELHILQAKLDRMEVTIDEAQVAADQKANSAAQASSTAQRPTADQIKH